MANEIGVESGMPQEIKEKMPKSGPVRGFAR